MIKNYIGVTYNYPDNVEPMDLEVQDLIVERVYASVKDELIQTAEKADLATIGKIISEIGSNVTLDELVREHLKEIVKGMGTVYYKGCESVDLNGESRVVSGRDDIKAYIDEVLTPLRNDIGIKAAIAKAMKRLSGDIETSLPDALKEEK